MRHTSLAPIDRIVFPAVYYNILHCCLCDACLCGCVSRLNRTNSAIFMSFQVGSAKFRVRFHIECSRVIAMFWVNWIPPKMPSMGATYFKSLYMLALQLIKQSHNMVFITRTTNSRSLVRRQQQHIRSVVSVFCV